MVSGEHTLRPKMANAPLACVWYYYYYEVCLEYICPNKQLNVKLVQYFQPKFVWRFAWFSYLHVWGKSVCVFSTWHANRHKQKTGLFNKDRKSDQDKVRIIHLKRSSDGSKTAAEFLPGSRRCRVQHAGWRCAGGATGGACPWFQSSELWLPDLPGSSWWGTWLQTRWSGSNHLDKRRQSVTNSGSPGETFLSLCKEMKEEPSPCSSEGSSSSIMYRISLSSCGRSHWAST